MSATGKDGVPAFPHVNPDYDGNWDKEPQRAGMSIRDWFAGKALAGICQSCGFQGGPWDVIANHAYEAADAMLKEREK